MSLRGYVKLTKPAPWLSTPSGKALARHKQDALAVHNAKLARGRRERRLAAGPVRGRSERERVRMAGYVVELKKWLVLPENVVCWACREETLGDRPRPTVDNHHRRGRLGPLLMDKRYWTPLCRAHHDKVKSDPDWARSLGLLPPLGGWNIVAEDNT